MPPFLTPPPTRIIGPDGVPLSGDVSLANGNNVGITRVGKILTVTANPPTSLRSVPVFGPGAAAPKILQRVNIASPVVQAIDAYCGVPPIGVDGSNHANIQVAGTISGGPIVLPMVGVTGEFHLGISDLTTPLAGETATGTTGGRAERAVAFQFQVSTQVVIRNIDAKFTGGSGSNVRMGIATGVVQGVTPVLTPNWIADPSGNQCFVEVAQSGSTRPFAALPGTTGFTLLPGTSYWFVASRLSNNDQLEIVSGTTQTSLGNLTTPGTVLTDVFSGGHYTDIFDTISGATKYPEFNLYGAVLGTALSGLVEVRYTVTGAPPGTTGSDVNMLIQC